jgi:hypothetical protein
MKAVDSANGISVCHKTPWNIASKSLLVVIIGAEHNTMLSQSAEHKRRTAQTRPHTTRANAQLFCINVPSRQLKGQLQTQHK